MAVSIVQTKGITKSYDGFMANKNISFQVDEGEIKAIVGENGAGKTTLMNIIYGLLEPDEGEILIRDNLVAFKSPADAIAHGIGMVHQHFKLVPSLTVCENVLLGIEETRNVKLGKKTLKTPFIDYKKETRRVQEIIDKYGFNLSADTRVRNLSVGAQQKVEILKMLYRDVDIIILDEPTSVLTPQEIRSLFETMRWMKEHGKTILFITHKLKEVMDVSDSVVVIKDGEIVGDMPKAETDEVDIARRMVGRDVLLGVEKSRKKRTEDVLIYEVENLSTVSDRGVEVVKNVSFGVRRGEILGVAGVEGNGQTELLYLLMGLMRATRGRVRFKGKNITNRWPKDIRRLGIGIIPEDRYLHGACKELTIADNIIAGYHNTPELCSWGFLKKKSIEERRDSLIEKFDVRISTKEGLVDSLSGGNTQKLIVAREFHADPDLLIASQPSRGIDVGSIEYMHQSLLDFAARGKAVLLISSELSEVMSLSDRIIVMFRGEIIGELDAAKASREEVGLLMAGIEQKGSASLHG